MTENEFILYDRLEVIKNTIAKYGEGNFFLYFSGGKDSMVVHRLLDMAIPDNRIPRVFCNTGIEYNAIVEFVRDLSNKDGRFITIMPRKNIKAMLEEVGYPFKSKEHSQRLYEWQKGYRENDFMQRYLHKKEFGCPKILLYQFSDDFKLKVSHKCCQELKKNPFKKWQKENHRSITITGMMKDEGGQRTTIDCIVTKNDKVVKFHPLAKVDKEWEEWFVKEYDVKLCKLYYDPFNFKRTGCVGCPYSPNLQEQLSAMSKHGLENQRKQAEIIWKPVYDEYRRIGYRLNDEEQMELF